MFNNSCTFVGRITKDVVVTENNGTKVANFTIAVDNGKDNQGNKRDATFIRLAAFNKAAEHFGKYGKKGILVGVNTRYEESSYMKDGEKKYTNKFIIHEFQLLSFPNETNEQQANNQPPNYQQQQGYGNQQPGYNGGNYPPNNNYGGHDPFNQGNGAPQQGYQNQNYNGGQPNGFGGPDY